MKKYNNNDFTKKNIGEEVELYGWVQKNRNLGGLVFIDLRDRSGIIQLCVRPDNKNYDLASSLRNEYVIRVVGTIVERESKNMNIKTGEVEVDVKDLELLNKSEEIPFEIKDDITALEDTRLKYRYLDLRRPCMQHYFDIRDTIKMTTHSFMHRHHFIEVETPMLCASSPEGAKEYLVPSRVHHGQFYALPQSPQMFKQLLMVAGFERYYQIARCFRDEDLRADRQPDFTQIDVETSFLDQNQFLTLMEELIKDIFKNTINYDVKLPLRQMTYKEAMERFGSDKPDTRFGIELNNIKDIFANTTFAGYQSAQAIKAIVVPGVASQTSRKVIDSLTLEAKKFGLGGLTVLKKENGELTGSFLKFLLEEEKAALNDRLALKDDDLLIIAAGNDNRVTPLLGALRLKYGRELGLIKEGTYDLLWVIDFPMFERDVESGAIVATHHPFTRPRDEDLKYLDEDPTKVLSYAYDIVINGYEAGGGTLRIYNQDVQKKIFEILGLSDDEIKERFGYFVDALQYGTPPHAGMAYGLDRLAMILGGTDNIRDVIAFPKNLAAVDPMTNAPTPVTEEQLKELGIKIEE